MSILVDSHVHLHEYGDGWRSYCDGRYLMLAVSDDADSSVVTVRLGRECAHVVPAVGVHPWNAARVDVSETLRTVERLVVEHGIRFLGEVGLDRAFHPETFDVQLRLFEGFLRIASDYGLGLSVHAAGAWREAFEMLRRYRIPAAVFHWYTGPPDLLEEIVAEGYFIGINPALLVQKKHEAVLERSPLDSVLTESDGPYSYRGLTLGPEMLRRLLERISEIKSVDVDEVSKRVAENFGRLLSSVGLRSGVSPR